LRIIALAKAPSLTTLKNKHSPSYQIWPIDHSMSQQ
jgi:hypothetical protein